jgi:hypothetical protein
LVFDPKTLTLGPFYWFGGPPKQKLPDLTEFHVAKHTKGNAQGVKNLRPNLRVVPLSRFERIPSISLLTVRLFGPTVAHGDA